MRSPPTRRVLGVLAVAAAAATLIAQEPDPALPPLPVLPPIPEELSRPMRGDLRVVFTDVAFTRRGARVTVPHAEVVHAPGAAPQAVRLSLLHVRGARVSLPPHRPRPDSPSVAGDGATIDPFMPITDRPVDVARLRIDGGSIEQRGAGGWRYRDIDADVRDIVLGGSRTEGARVARADFDANIDGRAIALHRATARLRRSRSRLDASADFSLGHSAGTLRLDAVRNGAMTLDGRISTDDFGELHAWIDALPRTGTGTVDGRVALEDGRVSAEVRGAELRVGGSRVTARGGLAAGIVADAVIDIHRLHDDDLHAAFGARVPGGGAVHGRLSADGPLRQGVAVSGHLTRITTLAAAEQNGGTGEVPARLDTAAVQLSGLVRAEAGYDVALDLTIDAGTVGDRLVNRSTEADARENASAEAPAARRARLEPVVARVAAHVGTREAAWPVRGRVGVASELVFAETGRVVPVGAEAEGEVELRGARRVNVVIRPDSLPLELLPAPGAVRNVQGLATGELRVTGTMEEPRWRGWVNVAEAALDVPRAGTRLEDFGGRLEVDGYTVRTTGLSGRLGEGAVEVAGVARLGGDSAGLDARVRLERGRVIGLDSLWVVASADLRAAGPLTAPVVTGEVVVNEGAFLEDMTKHRRPLDVTDPPFAAVAERAPWLSGSRLLRGRAASPASGAGPQLDLDVVVTEGFRILDEDSEMFGVARVRVQGDVADLDAVGSYRVTGGEYNNFGERFRVVGGIFHFGGAGFAARVSLRAQHDHGAPIGTDLGSDGRAADQFPPLEFFALGSLSGVTEEVRRLALLRERPTELAALLLYGEPVEPISGWQQQRFWQSDGGGSLLGPRARAQAVPLLWAYTADEAYDWIPLERAYLRAGAVRVGPPFPGRLTATGIIGGGLRFDPLEIDVRQPTDAAALPGVQLRYSLGRWRFIALSEPRFRGDVALPGFAHTRRHGARMQWRTEW